MFFLDHLAFLDSRRQQDSKNSVSYRVRGAGDPGGGNGQLFPVQQEEELLQGKWQVSLPILPSLSVKPDKCMNKWNKTEADSQIQRTN